MSSTQVAQQGRGPLPISRRARNISRTRNLTSQQVRRKFFQKIGIVNHKSLDIPVSKRSLRDLRQVPTHNEPLQYDHEEERQREELRQAQQSRESQPSPSSVAIHENELTSKVTDGSAKRKRQVNFQESVTVVPIPMIYEYSHRIRSKLYTDSAEMYEMVERNIVEFSAERGDWRHAYLEEQMFVCGVTGKLIHPAHIQTSQYVFGSPTPSNTSSACSSLTSCSVQDAERYWDDLDVI
mmetsp:Transcript_36632/g.79083  ORF Transcript_36632/g.79083 Transcript_36632/m.79083 type:complete len:238 (-) Transcript_36632:429-1142(-)